MNYDALVIAAHSDDAETQMGGTIARLTQQGKQVLLVDLCDGEPTDYGETGVRAEQALRAARILGADRFTLSGQDRLVVDTIPLRLELARLIRLHQPRWVFGTAQAKVHPDHVAVEPLVTAAVFYSRLQNWDRVPGGEVLQNTQPWEVERLFLPHCKMEPAWGKDFDFAIDVSQTYHLKKKALAEYRSVFKVAEGDRLLELYEAEDMYTGRIFGVAYAEIFRTHSPLLLDGFEAIRPGIHA
ncbi:MAG TPA: PIG-L deacetylase family protein [Chloroflexia bacterium]|nr:PIG-L deacetylase family protein [Chloroflexia bacterium]